MLENYDIVQDILIVHGDNTSPIFNNPTQHSRIKHIDIRYHFIRD